MAERPVRQIVRRAPLEGAQPQEIGAPSVDTEPVTGNQPTAYESQIDAPLNPPRRGGLSRRAAIIGGTVLGILGAGGALGAVLASGGSDGGDSARVTFVDPSVTPTNAAEAKPSATPTTRIATVNPNETPAGKGDGTGDTSKGGNITPVPTETPKPTATATPTEAPKPTIPAELKGFLDDLDTLTLGTPAEGTPAQREANRKQFTEYWQKASTEREKWSVYRSLYSSLASCYISSCGPDQVLRTKVKAEMEKVEDFIAAKWPQYYNPNDGGWFR